MSEYKATIKWQRTSPDFLKGKYSREHTWAFDGGVTVPASSSPSVVPVALVESGGVDPEEAFVASLSSCHMLTFLHLACKAGFQIDSYEDEAIGKVTKNEKGMPWVSSGQTEPQNCLIAARNCPRPRTKNSCIIWRTNSATSPIRSKRKFVGRDGVSPSLPA